MKRMAGAKAQEELTRENRLWEEREQERARTIRDAFDAEDRRYQDWMGWRHRLTIKFFRKHFEVFSKALLSSAADRGTIESRQAKTMARSVEMRLEPGDG